MLIIGTTNITRSIFDVNILSIIYPLGVLYRGITS